MAARPTPTRAGQVPGPLGLAALLVAFGIALALVVAGGSGSGEEPGPAPARTAAHHPGRTPPRAAQPGTVPPARRRQSARSAGPPSPHPVPLPDAPRPVERSAPPAPRPGSSSPALAPDIVTRIPDAPAAARRPAGDPADPTLLDLRIGRITSRVVRAYRSGDDVLLPLAAFFALAEVRVDTGRGGLTGRLEPGGRRIAIDPAAGRLQLGPTTIMADSGQLRVIDGVLYGSMTRLGQLLGTSITLENEDAAVEVHDPSMLPVAQRRARDAARRAYTESQRSLASDVLLLPGGAAWNGLVVDYGVRTSSSGPLDQAVYDLGAATDVGGGSLVLRAQGSGGAVAALRGAWTGVWPGQRALTQLRVGDGALTGPRGQPSRGVSVTNAPFARPIIVQDLPFAGALPPDWSVEAYRSGRLVAFDSTGAAGTYSLLLPVQLGENPVDFVAYGPFGEIRTFNRTFRALPSMLTAGAFEYGASGGACLDDACSANGNVDLRYGLSRRWTLQGGLDQVWRATRPAFSSPYVGVFGAPTNAVGVDLEAAARSFARAGLRFEPSSRLRLTADYIGYADSSRGSPFVPPGTDMQWSLYGRLAPGRGTVVFEAQAARSAGAIQSQANARGGIAIQAYNMSVRPYARVEHIVAPSRDTRDTYVGVAATILPRPSLGSLLGRFWLDGAIEADTRGTPTAAAVTVSRNLGSGVRIEGGTSWQRNAGGAVVTAGVVTQLSSVRTTTQLTVPTGGGPARVEQGVAGSMVWSRAGTGLSFAAEPALDRAGVAGQVFLDLDGDGHREPGEPLLPGTRLVVNYRWVVADSSGRYQVWGLSPYEPMTIAVDTASLTSPWWTPAFNAVQLTLTPNQARVFDVPIVIGGVIEGAVTVDGGGSLPSDAAVGLVLTELDSGRRRGVDVFTDGSFYQMGVRPGRYELTLDRSRGEGGRFVADTVRFDLRPAPTDAAGPSAARGSPAAALQTPGPTVTGLALRLRRTEPAREP